MAGPIVDARLRARWWIDDWISTDEIPYERPGTGWSADGNREYVRRFQVMVKNNKISAAEMCYAPGIPVPYAPYVSKDGDVYDESAFNIKTSAMQPEKRDAQRWIVTCEYTNNFDPISDGTPQKDMRPDRQPPNIEWDFEVVHQALPADLDGKPFMNSARMPFSPTPTFEQAFAIMVYTRNELDFDRKRAADYSYALNSDEFFGAKKGQAQCLPPKAEQVRKGKWIYWRVTYRIRFRDDEDWVALPLPSDLAQPSLGSIIGLTRKVKIPRTWQPQFLDQGMCELKPIPFSPPITGLGLLTGGLAPVSIAREEPTPILKKGLPISQPVCLDGNGHEQKQDPQTGKVEPVYLPFRVYKERKFADILVNGFRFRP
jgi:hypothetical protein